MIHGKPSDGKFFELNDEHRYVPEIGDLIKAHGESAADDYMWAIWLMYHPNSSIYELNPEGKEKWILSRYLKVKEFDWAILDDAIRAFPQFAMTIEQRAYYDAVTLYDMTMAESRLLGAKDKIQVLKSMSTISKLLEDMKKKYITAEANTDIKTSGDAQSGRGSRRKGKARNKRNKR